MITIRNRNLEIQAVLTLGEYLALTFDQICAIIEGSK